MSQVLFMLFMRLPFTELACEQVGEQLYYSLVLMCQIEIMRCKWLAHGTDYLSFLKINEKHVSMVHVTVKLVFSCNVSCQFSDIGSYNQLSNEQKQFISEQTRLFARNVP